MNTSNKPFLPRTEEFLDCTGNVLRFEFALGQQSEGVVVNAYQVEPENSPGYEFSAWSATIGDALGKLRRKIREGISRRYLAEHPKHGLSLLNFGFSGLVDSGGITIDGRHAPFDWLIEQLQSFEGWKIEVKITDPAE